MRILKLLVFVPLVLLLVVVPIVHIIGYAGGYIFDAIFKEPAKYGLVGNPEEWLGKQLTLEPFYGWGWSSADGYIDVPLPLEFTLDGLEFRDGNPIGGYGKITTQNHRFSGHWINFSLRHVQQASLLDESVDYNVGIARYSLDPSIYQQDEAKGLHGTGYAGYGTIYGRRDN